MVDSSSEASGVYCAALCDSVDSDGVYRWAVGEAEGPWLCRIPASASAGPVTPLEILRDCGFSGSISLSVACGVGADGEDLASASLVISI